MTNLPARTDGIPASLLDIAEVFGMRVALALVQHFGGRDMKFPSAPGPGHPVIKALGETDGSALCRYLGGQDVYIPHCRPRKSAAADVARLEERGLDRAEIARALGISMRHVRRVANRLADGRQGMMDFD